MSKVGWKMDMTEVIPLGFISLPPFTPPTGAVAEKALTLEAARRQRRRKERNLFIVLFV